MEYRGHKDFLGRRIDFVQEAIVTHAEPENPTSRNRQLLDVEAGSGLEGVFFQKPEGRENTSHDILAACPLNCLQLPRKARGDDHRETSHGTALVLLRQCRSPSETHHPPES